MALYSDLPVYKSTYDLLVDIFCFTKDFKKEYKYTVGESLKKFTCFTGGIERSKSGTLHFWLEWKTQRRKQPW
jgi:hypothetical protein